MTQSLSELLAQAATPKTTVDDTSDQKRTWSEEWEELLWEWNNLIVPKLWSRGEWD